MPTPAHSGYVEKELPWGAVRTLEEVGKLMNMSRQRVYQIEQSAFKKLRRAFPGLEELLAGSQP